MDNNARIDDDLVEKTINELESSVSRDLCDPDGAKIIFGHIGTVSVKEECECKKKAVVRVY